MFKHRSQFALWVVLLTFTAANASADETSIEQLIDELVHVKEPGFGYSMYFSGTQFLPYADTEDVGALVLGAPPAVHSEMLRKIVEHGVDAVTVLLKHLSDDRKIEMAPVGMFWMEFPDEYDFNRRTAAKIPEQVNRKGNPQNQQIPNKHSLTVGDLCFTALGQIVNRNFCATRYQPSGGVVVNSPTFSPSLWDVIIAD